MFLGRVCVSVTPLRPRDAHINSCVPGLVTSDTTATSCVTPSTQSLIHFNLMPTELFITAPLHPPCTLSTLAKLPNTYLL